MNIRNKLKKFDKKNPQQGLALTTKMQLIMIFILSI